MDGGDQSYIIYVYIIHWHQVYKDIWWDLMGLVPITAVCDLDQWWTWRRLGLVSSASYWCPTDCQLQVRLCNLHLSRSPAGLKPLELNLVASPPTCPASPSASHVTWNFSSLRGPPTYYHLITAPSQGNSSFPQLVGGTHKKLAVIFKIVLNILWKLIHPSYKKLLFLSKSLHFSREICPECTAEWSSRFGQDYDQEGSILLVTIRRSNFQFIS